MTAEDRDLEKKMALEILGIYKRYFFEIQIENFFNACTSVKVALLKQTYDGVDAKDRPQFLSDLRETLNEIAGGIILDLKMERRKKERA